MSVIIVRFNLGELSAINAAYALRAKLNHVEQWADGADWAPYGRVENLCIDLLVDKYGLDFAKAVDNQMIESGLDDVVIAIEYEAAKLLDS